MVNAAIDKNFEYFLKNSFSGFEEGEWIAIHKNKVIAHNSNLKGVITDAKKQVPLSQVLISKVKKTACYL